MLYFYSFYNMHVYMLFLITCVYNPFFVFVRPSEKRLAVFHQRQEKKNHASTKALSRSEVTKSPRLQNLRQIAGKKDSTGKKYSTHEGSSTSKATIDLSMEETPTPKPVAKDDTWKQDMEAKMNTLLAHIADIANKSSTAVVGAPVPSAVSVPSDVQQSSSCSVLPTVDEAAPFTDASEANVRPTVDEAAPLTDTSKANDDGGGSVASSKRKRQTTSKNTSDISSSARVTRGAMRRVQAEDEGTVDK
jgi:hypothetical protein